MMVILYIYYRGMADKSIAGAQMCLQLTITRNSASTISLVTTIHWYAGSSKRVLVVSRR